MRGTSPSTKPGADPDGSIKIAVASGKGGTGKTTIAVALASALDPVQLLDCDVEAPNAHLFVDSIDPADLERQAVSIPVPSVDSARCTACRLCAEVCQFNALTVLRDRVLVFPDLCHGCGACATLCPEGAIYEVDRGIGVLEAGRSNGLDFVQGRLDPGKPMAVPIIREVLERARPTGTVIIDCSPGTSCSVVTVIRAADVCLLVTEPTPLGLHDLKLSVAVCRLLSTPAAVIINRSDIGDDAVETYCGSEGLPVLLRLPFDRGLARAYARGERATEAMPALSEQLRQVKAELVALAGRANAPWKRP